MFKFNERYEKAKLYCKDHKTHILVAAAGGFTAVVSSVFTARKVEKDNEINGVKTFVNADERVILVRQRNGKITPAFKDHDTPNTKKDE